MLPKGTHAARRGRILLFDEEHAAVTLDVDCVGILALLQVETDARKVEFWREMNK